MFRSIAFAALAAAGLATSASAQDADTLKVGMSGTQPPMNVVNRDGALMGMDVDLARLLAGAMGVRLEIVPIPFTGLLDALEAGEVDIVLSGVTATLQRNLRVRSGATAAARSYLTDNGFTEVTGPGASPAPIGPAHSGSWNNEDQRGHGFSMEFGNNFEGNPYAVIYWYIYDDTGQPIFMVGQGTPEGNRVEVTFYSPVGMIYGEFDPGAVPDPLDVGGTGVFEFADSDNATFSYAPSEFSETVWGHSTPVENLALKKFFGIPAEPVFPSPR